MSFNITTMTLNLSRSRGPLHLQRDSQTCTPIVKFNGVFKFHYSLDSTTWETYM